MKNIKIIIEGQEFNIFPFKTLDASDIERRLMTVLFPVLSDFLADIDVSNGKIDKSKIDLDFSKMANGFRLGLGSLDKQTYINLIVDCLANTQTKNNKGVLTFLNSEANINECVKSTMIVYRLIFEVMKANSLAFFELLDGKKTVKTDSIE